MIVRFTLCEYGGGEITSCTVSGGEDFAYGFEQGLNLRIDAETHYIVREELLEHELADDGV